MALSERTMWGYLPEEPARFSTLHWTGEGGKSHHERASLVVLFGGVLMPPDGSILCCCCRCCRIHAPPVFIRQIARAAREVPVVSYLRGYP